MNDLLDIVTMRLIVRVAYGADMMGHLTPAQMVSLGLNDPRKIFVKDEPHSSKKKTRKAWRCIWNVSIIDQMCQLIVHYEQNKADIDAYKAGRLDVQANGLGHHDEGIQHLGEMFQRVFKGPVVDDDASGWDLSVTRDAIYLDAERRSYLLAGAHSDPVMKEKLEELFDDLLFCEAAANSSHVIAIGNRLYESQRFGITASGIPSTSGQNSPIRSILAKLAGAHHAITLGDDLVYTGPADREFMQACGIRNKGDATTYQIGEPISFTSHFYTLTEGGKWIAVFQNLPKMLARVCFTPTLDRGFSDRMHGTIDDKTYKLQVANAMYNVVRADPQQMETVAKFAMLRGWIESSEELRITRGFDPIAFAEANL